MFTSTEQSVNLHRPKVGWLCTYTPEEVIYAAGFQPYRLLPDENSNTGNDRLLPPTLCPYTRRVAAALEEGVYPDLKGLVVANSCNAMLHLYNVLRERSDRFVYLLDPPRRFEQTAVEYFAAQIGRMIRFFADAGHPVTRESLGAALALYRETGFILERLAGGGNGWVADGIGTLRHYEMALAASRSSREAFNRQLGASLDAETAAPAGENPAGPGRPGLLLTGAPPPAGLVKLLAAGSLRLPVYQDSCIGSRYWHSKDNYAGLDGATRGHALPAELVEGVDEVEIGRASCRERV